jgi:leucyl-tRNA synthetase
VVSYSKETDQKWQRKWQETGLYKFNEDNIGKKYYLLEMFSYPSGKNLHIGHWWNYGLSDSYGRFKRMQGYEVFHPPGFDAFGLPAENYAIKTGMHPKDSTDKNIETMEQQFRSMGTTYDWDYEIVTCHEEYYRWTQWLFLQLYKNGLAYRKEAPVNWCPSCKTVLSNEQSSGGKCERCGSEVLRKNMAQWFFKITAYAEELLAGLDKLDWPEKTKQIQKNWIGKSSGTEIIFTSGEHDITVFTTRADTLFGVTYLVLAPEHPLIDTLATNGQKAAVKEYKEYTSKRSEIERTSAGREKTGVFTGAYAKHPMTGKPIPIWISDYVLMGYGTGAVMAVPAHDDRDYDFALKFRLPVTNVISQGDTLINSGMELSGKGSAAVKYRMRDWSVSRQRYWGCPIPIVYCEDCGAVPADESDLPVKLPYNVEFMPDGHPPLTGCEEFVNTPCPKCGKPGRRETDTLDTFVCSSWYYLRFYDCKDNSEPFDRERVSQIMPVDKYVGGIEHASMHLLYARFVTKALRDMGWLTFGEPFPSLVHQGIITGKDGKKMSKRDGAVPPDVLIDRYGSDVFRMHLGFSFSYLEGGPWNDDGIKAVARFVYRIIKTVENFVYYSQNSEHAKFQSDFDVDYIRNSTIKEVTKDYEAFGFNTAIARIMEFLNAIQRYQKSGRRTPAFESTLVKDLILLLAPMAPHLTEELWEFTGGSYSVHNQPFPVCDETKLTQKLIDIAVQVNGTLRDVISIDLSANEDTVKTLAMNSEKIKKEIGSKNIKNIIYVKGKVVNIVY